MIDGILESIGLLRAAKYRNEMETARTHVRSMLEVEKEAIKWAEQAHEHAEYCKVGIKALTERLRKAQRRIDDLKRMARGRYVAPADERDALSDQEV